VQEGTVVVSRMAAQGHAEGFHLECGCLDTVLHIHKVAPRFICFSW
jgi:hypothetical protein